jgi:hypothetical protein
VCHKFLEKLIYNRISPIIEEKLPIEQAGFRTNRNCFDQVLALTSYIESGFQKRLKTGVVFVDLTAAYDTVWKDLIHKLYNVIPCGKMVSLYACPTSIDATSSGGARRFSVCKQTVSYLTTCKIDFLKVRNSNYLEKRKE